MKKNLILLALLIFSLLAKSQNKNILIQYESIRNNITNIETLIAGKQKAVFIIDSLLIENNNSSKQSEEDKEKSIYRISQKRIQFDPKSFFIQKGNNTVFFTEKYKGVKSIIKDELPKFNWNLESNEIKKIGNFVCKKATTNYRGSQIVAWYAEELNYPFGPWKFKDLPGIILEVYNINSQSIEHWVAKKITFPFNKAVNFEYKNILPIVSLKAAIDEENVAIQEQMRLMGARAPKGVITTSSKISRLGIEQIFEWEK
jgi:GLPGLI family protein